MITRKRCVNCANYDGWACPNECTSDSREHWTPRHGEWISTALVKPLDEEIVAIIHSGITELAIYSKRRKAFISEKGWMSTCDDAVKWWMRFEKVPPDER